MTRYYVMRDGSGAVIALCRIRHLPNAIYTELLRDGEWIDCPSVGEFFLDVDPRNKVDDDEAAEIARRLGGHL
ncbi:MAG TPA: hypothetical protein VFP91_20790 [Vicinamibacterales bacterium]|nr:hypothetical protein [Vicinamibacterales bacterium]